MTIELKPVLDSFLPYVWSVLSDVTNIDREGFQTERRQSFTWNGGVRTAITMASRDGMNAGVYRLSVEFTYQGEYPSSLFAQHPELSIALTKLLQAGNSGLRWRVRETKVDEENDRLNMAVTWLPL